jgi:hypothetical protein
MVAFHGRSIACWASPSAVRSLLLAKLLTLMHLALQSQVSCMRVLDAARSRGEVNLHG